MRHQCIDCYISHPLCFQVHQEIDKIERKRLCRILDCKKLSVEASKNAAQNQLLPLRVIVQILFVEQARAAIVTNTNNITNNETAVLRRSFTTRREEDADLERVEIKPNGGFQSTPSRFMALCSIPRQPKKMFCKLLSISRSLSQRIWKEKMVGDFLFYWFLVTQVKCFSLSLWKLIWFWKIHFSYHIVKENNKENMYISFLLVLRKEKCIWKKHILQVKKKTYSYVTNYRKQGNDVFAKSPPGN